MEPPALRPNHRLAFTYSSRRGEDVATSTRVARRSCSSSVDALRAAIAPFTVADSVAATAKGNRADESPEVERSAFISRILRGHVAEPIAWRIGRTARLESSSIAREQGCVAAPRRRLSAAYGDRPRTLARRVNTRWSSNVCR